jgi:hypothetical protein
VGESKADAADPAAEDVGTEAGGADDESGEGGLDGFGEGKPGDSEDAAWEDAAAVADTDGLDSAESPEDTVVDSGDADADASVPAPQPPPEPSSCLPEAEQVALCTEGPQKDGGSFALNRWNPIEPHGAELFTVVRTRYFPKGAAETSGVYGDCQCGPRVPDAVPNGIVWHRFDGDENRVVEMEYCPFPTDRPEAIVEETSDLEDYMHSDVAKTVDTWFNLDGVSFPEKIYRWEQAGWNYGVPLGFEWVATSKLGPVYLKNLLVRWTEDFPQQPGMPNPEAKNFQYILAPIASCTFPAGQFEASGCVQGQPQPLDEVNFGNTFRIRMGDKDDPYLDKNHDDPTKPTAHTFYGVMKRAGLTFIRLGGWGIGGNGYAAIEVRGTTPGVYESDGFHSNPAAIIYASSLTPGPGGTCSHFCTSNSSGGGAAFPGRGRVVIEQVDENRVKGHAEAWLIPSKNEPSLHIEFDLGFQTCR